MNLRTSVAKLFTGNVLTAVVQFGAIVGFTQALGTAAVGSFFVFQAVIGMLGIPVDLGISRTAEKRLSGNGPPGEIICTALLLKTVLVVPWLVGLLLAGPYLEQYVGIPGSLPLVIAGLLTSQARRLGLRLLAGQLRVDRNALLKLVGEVVWAGAGFAFVVSGWTGAAAIVTSLVLGHLATVAGALVRLDIRLDWPQVDRARDLLGFGRYVFVGDVGGYIYQWMDVAILRLFVPVSLIGAYEIAWRVASVSILVTKAIRTSLFPKISNWYADDQIEKIESAFYDWIQVPLYLTIPAFAGAVVLGRDVLGTVFGSEATVAYPVLVLFMLEKIVRSVQLVVGPSLFAMDKPHLGYRGSAAAIVVNLTLNLALIPAFGVIGAAVATTVGAVTAATVAIGYVRSFISIRVPWTRIGWSILSAAVMAVVVYAVRLSLSPGLVRLVVGVGTGVCVYFALLFANRGIKTGVYGVIRDVRGS
jgi:O-antigen/teichoic acid export membrane protein